VVPTAISAAVPRQRSTLDGQVTAVRAYVRPWVRFDVEMTDGTGSVTLRFIGRHSVPGMIPGRPLRVEGTPTVDHSKLVMLNPLYEFRPESREKMCEPCRRSQLSEQP
jgi:hypothetical protein